MVENHNVENDVDDVRELHNLELGAHLGVGVDHGHKDEDGGKLAEVAGPQDVEKHEVENDLNVVKKNCTT